MVKIFLSCTVFIAIFAISALSQTRTVTNNDLAQYRDKRLAAERELREDYARLGFPSPEIRAARDVESAKRLTELSLRLRSERLEKERREAERSLVYVPYQRDVIVTNSQPFYSNFYWRYPSRYYQGSRQYQQPGYFAGGMFIPTGPRTPPQPVFIRPRR